MKLRLHPSVSHGNKILKNVPMKTGRTLDEWQTIVDQSGCCDVKSVQAQLKTHGLGGVTAFIVAEYVLGLMDRYNPAHYMSTANSVADGQYAGKREHLLPIRDKLIDIAESFGRDLAFSPCKTYIPVYRNHVIAHIKASTQKRVDLFLALGAGNDIPLKKKSAAVKGDRITHVIGLSSVDDITGDVINWFRRAYESDS